MHVTAVFVVSRYVRQPSFTVALCAISLETSATESVRVAQPLDMLATGGVVPADPARTCFGHGELDSPLTSHLHCCLSCAALTLVDLSYDTVCEQRTVNTQQ